jgi:hypothetical protein
MMRNFWQIGVNEIWIWVGKMCGVGRPYLRLHMAEYSGFFPTIHMNHHTCRQASDFPNTKKITLCYCIFLRVRLYL